ncbi:MAG: methyl-accepting chemotaxis protein [Oligoflexales bacterium]|nr:methyl-accepting chemotaxis protein [Oligoflexales bacterium]
MNIQRKLTSCLLTVVALSVMAVATSTLQVSKIHKCNERSSSNVAAIVDISQFDGKLAEIKGTYLGGVVGTMMGESKAEAAKKKDKIIAEMDWLIDKAGKVGNDEMRQNFESLKRVLSDGLVPILKSDSYGASETYEKKLKTKIENAQIMVRNFTISSRDDLIEESDRISKSTTLEFWFIVSVVISISVLVTLMLYFVIKAIVKKFRMMDEHVHKYQRGELSQRIDFKQEDEFKNLANTFNTMADSINNNIELRSKELADIKQMVNKVDEAMAVQETFSEELESVASGFQVETENQMKAIHYIGENIKNYSTDIASSNKIFTETETEGITIKNSISKEISHLDSIREAIVVLEESTKRITNFLKVISGITFQINLISLNASVEAARAGEHGKGFAVVADEVRNLAKKSASSSAEIEDLVRRTHDHVGKSILIVNETTDSLHKFMGNIDAQMGRILGLANVARRQSDKIKKITEDLAQINRGTMHFMDESSEMVEMSQRLARGMESLKKTVEQFSSKG